MSKLIKAFENLKDSLNIKELDYLILGERKGARGKIVTKKMKVSDFLNKTAATKNREQIFPAFPYLVEFIQEYVYYSNTTPTTGDITVSQTDSVLGLVQKLYHNDGAPPSFSGVSDIQIIGTGTYITGVLNIIYLEWTEANRVEYWITQEGAQISCVCILDCRPWTTSPFLNYCNGTTLITPTNGAQVHAGGYYIFDGINDYLDNGVAIEPTIFTFNTWVNFDNINIDNRLMSYRDNSGNSYYIFMRVNTSNVIELQYKDFGNPTIGNFTSSTTIASATWYNIAIGIDGNSTVKMWLNGLPIAVNTNLVGTRSTTLIPVPHRIGGDAARTMDGKMGNFKISECMLSDTEVLNNFNTQKSIYGL